MPVGTKQYKLMMLSIWMVALFYSSMQCSKFIYSIRWKGGSTLSSRLNFLMRLFIRCVYALSNGQKKIHFIETTESIWWTFCLFSMRILWQTSKYLATLSNHTDDALGILSTRYYGISSKFLTENFYDIMKHMHDFVMNKFLVY